MTKDSESTQAGNVIWVGRLPYIPAPDKGPGWLKKVIDPTQVERLQEQRRQQEELGSKR